MLSAIYLGAIEIGAVIGAIYGCYKGLKIIDGEGPSTSDLYEDGRIVPACISATMGCGWGMLGGALAGALSPFLVTGLLTKWAHNEALMIMRLCLKNAHEKAAVKN
ncbi:hypothetical protein BNJ_00396 [Kaumoebavirus]|uniref:hypothetical protein n=1 Tax=Kaumoebavirus TaxID=1859492 RepID=UPI0009C3AB56|nr:hypothetical protein BNJ_00396 [Kaumoebavirus]ARA72215.1 hypothetical protein BNJ_00396 [Kaumoebavirus]